MVRGLLAVAVAVAVAGCGHPKTAPPDYLAIAERQGKRIEPWSQAHSDWLGGHCEVTSAGGSRFHASRPHSKPGNVILVVGFNDEGAALFVGYECESPPPWPVRHDTTKSSSESP